MLSALRNNLPKNKPELWRHFPTPFLRHISALRRREVIADIGESMHMKLDLRDQICRHLYLYGVYDPFVTSVIRTMLSSGGTFVDVGANIGTYSLLASRIVGASGQVYAFEPCSRNIARLKENLALNQITNVRVLTKALSSTSGSLDLFDRHDPGNSGTTSAIPFEGASKITVACTTFDEELADAPIDLIKMDIEGWEDKAILGGKKLFGRTRLPAIICEGEIFCQAATLLREFGYSVSALPRRWYTPANFIATRHL